MHVGAGVAIDVVRPLARDSRVASARSASSRTRRRPGTRNRRQSSCDEPRPLRQFVADHALPESCSPAASASPTAADIEHHAGNPHALRVIALVARRRRAPRQAIRRHAGSRCHRCPAQAPPACAGTRRGSRISASESSSSSASRAVSRNIRSSVTPWRRNGSCASSKRQLLLQTPEEFDAAVGRFAIDHRHRQSAVAQRAHQRQRGELPGAAVDDDDFGCTVPAWRAVATTRGARAESRVAEAHEDGEHRPEFLGVAAEQEIVGEVLDDESRQQATAPRRPGTRARRRGRARSGRTSWRSRPASRRTARGRRRRSAATGWRRGCGRESAADPPVRWRSPRPGCAVRIRSPATPGRRCVRSTVCQRRMRGSALIVASTDVLGGKIGLGPFPGGVGEREARV